MGSDGLSPERQLPADLLQPFRTRLGCKGWRGGRAAARRPRAAAAAAAALQGLCGHRALHHGLRHGPGAGAAGRVHARAEDSARPGARMLQDGGGVEWEGLQRGGGPNQSLGLARRCAPANVGRRAAKEAWSTYPPPNSPPPPGSTRSSCRPARTCLASASTCARAPRGTGRPWACAGRTTPSARCAPGPRGDEPTVARPVLRSRGSRLLAAAPLNTATLGQARRRPPAACPPVHAPSWQAAGAPAKLTRLAPRTPTPPPLADPAGAAGAGGQAAAVHLCARRRAPGRAHRGPRHR
jgi:hypothetical protein